MTAAEPTDLQLLFRQCGDIQFVPNEADVTVRVQSDRDCLADVPGQLAGADQVLERAVSTAGTTLRGQYVSAKPTQPDSRPSRRGRKEP